MMGCFPIHWISPSRLLHTEEAQPSVRPSVEVQRITEENTRTNSTNAPMQSIETPGRTWTSAPVSPLGLKSSIKRPVKHNTDFPGDEVGSPDPRTPDLSAITPVIRPSTGRTGCRIRAWVDLRAGEACGGRNALKLPRSPSPNASPDLTLPKTRLKLLLLLYSRCRS